jgi:uncharacterized protein (DUF433 family)
MSRIDWRNYVAITSETYAGEPCIKGTRVPVSVIVGSLADGMTYEEIQQAYPQLTSNAIRAALAYAAEILHYDLWIPLPVDTRMDQEGTSQ